MLSNMRADYGSNPAIALAPLSEEIEAEAARDEELLTLRQTPMAQGIPVAVLPNPVPTPIPTPIPIPPTPTPTPVPPTPTTEEPTAEPTEEPTAEPTEEPTAEPTEEPTAEPTEEPTAEPTEEPTAEPTEEPTAEPTEEPTAEPTEEPTAEPTEEPPPEPVVAFSDVTYNVNEGNGSATITVMLSDSSAQVVTVDYATSDGTATAGSDYIATSGTLNFAPGQVSRTFEVLIIDDNLANEPDETVILTLSNPSNATLGTPNPATLIIEDNDGQPTVQFEDPTYRVDEDKGPAIISVALSLPSAVTVTVDYATSDGTAIAGSDYMATSGTLGFAPGQVNRTFQVPIIDDNLANEPDETVILTLSNPNNAALGAPNPATLTIVDTDQTTVQFDRPTYNVDEDKGPAIITVTLSLPSVVTATVDYATSDGTADAGSDYMATSGTLSFAPGEIIRTFAVSITNDAITNEFNETVVLTLSNPDRAIIGAPNPATLIIVDDDGPPTVQFNPSTYGVDEDKGPAVITVTLSAESALPVMVDYTTTTSGTASIGGDYVPISGTLTFTPPVVTQTFNVEIIDDVGGPDPDKDVILKLSNPINATLGIYTATLTIIDDDVGGVCTDSNPPGTVDIGPPDCMWTTMSGITITTDITLGGPPIGVDLVDPDYDLVYYERRRGAAFSEIAMDRVIVQVAQNVAGPWYQVFYWGDGVVDANTNIGQAGYGDTIAPTEPNDTPIPMTDPPLYRPSVGPITGIAIDVDAPLNAAGAPAGAYPFVRLIDPEGQAEVDSIEVIP